MTYGGQLTVPDLFRDGHCLTTGLQGDVGESSVGTAAHQCRPIGPLPYLAKALSEVLFPLTSFPPTCVP